jgi:hypothetical protein
MSVRMLRVPGALAKVAGLVLSADEASAAVVWPEPPRSGTDSALAAFEDELRALASSSDHDVLGTVQARGAGLE